MSFLPQTLEIDEGIFDRNLRIVDGSGHEDIFNAQQYPSQNRQPLLPQVDMPSIKVTPDPGICVKTKNVKGAKVFVNLCKVQEIPPAPAITEDKLKEIIAIEDYDTDFRIPMSLGAPTKCKDKSGNECLKADVALNSAWFEDTMENSIIFTTFAINIAMEGLKDKYGDEVNLDRQNWTILKNKKYMGELSMHHIQQRAKGNKIQDLGKEEEVSPLISEFKVEKNITNQKKNKEVPNKTSSLEPSRFSSATTSEITPRFKLFKEPRHSDIPDRVKMEVNLDGVKSIKEVTLDIGEDRIVLEARKMGYLLDIFLPFSVDSKSVLAIFEKSSNVLHVSLPVV